jgi:hypothetical protein
MEITRSHVENVRRAAKAHGISPSSEQIKAAIIECYPVATDETVFDTQMIPNVVEILLAQQPSQPLDIPPKVESSIVLTDDEKQDLVAGAAQEVGLQLVASEIKTIATSIRSGFDSREQLLTEVMNAIVAYAENRIDHHSASLAAAANRIRSKVDAGNKEARNAFASIEKALEATNNDFKSELEGITALFPIAAAADWN